MCPAAVHDSKTYCNVREGGLDHVRSTLRVVADLDARRWAALDSFRFDIDHTAMPVSLKTSVPVAYLVEIEEVRVASDLRPNGYSVMPLYPC